MLIFIININIIVYLHKLVIFRKLTNLCNKINAIVTISECLISKVLANGCHWTRASRPLVLRAFSFLYEGSYASCPI